MSDDFFTVTIGERKRLWQRRRVAGLFDPLFDMRISQAMKDVRRLAGAQERRNIVVAAVSVPGREAVLDRLFDEFARSRHAVACRAVPMGERGKFENINAVLQDLDLDGVDWLIVTDDDVRLPPHFIDDCVVVAEILHLKIAQPAHRCLSYASFTFNHRRWGALGRVTGYVEDGPVTFFHRDMFRHVLPFPALRWAWGTDLAWCAIAERHGMAMGIIDCAPIEHLKPVAANYPVAAAIAEARSFLASCGLHPRREDLFVDRAVLTAVRP